jgi:hypothetical protein
MFLGHKIPKLIYKATRPFQSDNSSFNYKENSIYKKIGEEKVRGGAKKKRVGTERED